MRNKRGFTLTELIVVMIIVGILASVAVPIMSGYSERARNAEAISALGTIRTVMTNMRGQTRGYDTLPSGATISDGDVVATVLPDLSASDLTGKHFTSASYKFDDMGHDTFTVYATYNSEYSIGINERGVITVYDSVK